MLKQNSLLHRATLFVQDEKDDEEYRKIIPNDIKIVLAPRKNGPESYRVMCEYYPENYPLVFMDDDLEEFFTFDENLKLTRRATTLHETLVEGFKLIDEHNLGSFGFLWSTNKLYIQKRKRIEFRFPFLQGAAFACRNNKELVFGDSILEDSERTAKFYKKYGGSMVFNRCGFLTKWAYYPGGAKEQDSRRKDTRLETTKRASEELLVQHLDVYKSVKHNKTYDWYDLKMHHPFTLAKNLIALGAPVRKMFFD